MKTLEELGINPGPWSYRKADTLPCIYIGFVHGIFIAATSFNEHMEADAKLISSAPELYACLRKLWESYDHSPWGEVLEDQIKYALEKAGGAE